MLQITDKIRAKVLREYAHGYSANRSKNALFETQKDIYGTKKNSELLRSHLFRAIQRTIQATCIINKPDVAWEDEDCLYLQEARNFTQMYKHDYIKNNWDFYKYMQIEDICRYWKAVTLFTGWDDKKKTPTTERIDPRFVYPYNEWSYLVQDYPFFWFDRIVTKEELELLWVNSQQKEQIMHHYDEYVNGLKTDDAFLRDICTCYDKETGHYTVHYHYTYIDEQLYLFLMLWDVILDVYDVPETDNIIPISVMWFAYDSTDWRWVSLCDIIEDSHRTEQLLLNLYKIKVTREATWGNIFIDEEVFMKNKESLKNQSIKNRRFPVKMRDLTKPISSMVYELPQTQVSWDIYNALEMVKNKAMWESFASASTQWLWLSTNSDPETATETKVQKQNANMMTSLQNSILAYWSEEFANLYRDFVLYWWKDWTKSIRRIPRGLSWTYKKLTVRDIQGNFNVVLEDPVQWQLDAEEKKKALQEQYNMVVNDQSTPPFILDNIRRMIWYYNGLDENEIDSTNIFDPEWYQCKQDIILLNQNQDIYIPVQCDPHKRLWYYNKAEDTDAKFKAIQALQYMIRNNLGQQQQQMAVQPKVDQALATMQNPNLNVTWTWKL